MRSAASGSNGDPFHTDVINAFSIDVEDYFHVAALAEAISPTDWKNWEYRAESNTDRILTLLAERGISGTFFVLGWIADRSPGLVRRIARAGHEIASHGYSHRLVYRQTPSEFVEETSRSKALLEDLCGVAVVGYRAASFSITAQSLWALDVLIDLGFQYDSSIFPIWHDRYGMPGASLRAGMITAPSGRSIAEFPMSTAKVAGFQLPVSGGGYFRLLPYSVTRAALRKINFEEHEPFTFYLHPWEIDPEQPRVKVSLRSRFRHYTNLTRCESRLRQLLGEFQFAPMRTVLAQKGLLGEFANLQMAPP
jgi:polysaccharide deacetylase family protein (PEP-CTERM system associated)